MRVHGIELDGHRFEADMRRFEDEMARTPPAPGGIVFAGSSSFTLWTTLADDLAPLPVINRGFGGSISRDAHGRRRARRSTRTCCASTRARASTRPPAPAQRRR